MQYRSHKKFKFDMLRTPVPVARATQMSAGNSGQVATALKSVLEKIAAAAQRSGRNTQVCLDFVSFLFLLGSVHQRARSMLQVICLRSITSGATPKHMSDLHYKSLLFVECSHGWWPLAKQSLWKQYRKPTILATEYLGKITFR